MDHVVLPNDYAECGWYCNPDLSILSSGVCYLSWRTGKYIKNLALKSLTPFPPCTICFAAQKSKICKIQFICDLTALVSKSI